VRVIVEKAFGVVKRKWKIVRTSVPEYSIKKQVQIVYAVIALHNFIIRERAGERPDGITDNLLRAQTEILSRAAQRAKIVVPVGHDISVVRRDIAHSIWAK
jgi:DDE superfamily endonuclease